MNDLPSFASLAPEKRLLLCNSIKDVLARSSNGLSICAVRGAVWRIEEGRQNVAARSKVKLDNMLGCTVNVSMVTDALVAMRRAGDVVADTSVEPMIWRVPRRRQSSLTR